MRRHGWLWRSVATLAVMVLVAVPAVSSGPQASAIEKATIYWSGYTWNLKTSTGVVGPGPNLFSDSPDNVFVDSAGMLHLSIVETADGWTAAEVGSVDSFGYGSYQWTIVSDLTTSDPNTVLGMFTWSDEPEYNHREVDIEYADWGNPDATDIGSFAVQNGQFPTPHTKTFPPAHGERSVHTMTWSPGKVDFSASSEGSTVTWSFSGDSVPVPGGEHPRMNLWLFQGNAPEKPQTVVMERFQYTPPIPPDSRHDRPGNPDHLWDEWQSE